MPQTGATRYQKFLKSEKAKTKLKAKKDLPKGTNVTKTNFKVKKIVIKEQLKTRGGEALSTRKLNVKDLLSRLNHFNTNSRVDALDGLKEIVSLYPEVLSQNLGQIIHGVTPLVMNIEKNVRRESFKVLHTILTNVVVNKIDPFFDIMSTYLRSAMTHIDNRIQEDSLLFLDILLQCTPDKITQDFHKIVPNFIDMISKMRIESKPGRTLTVNLDSQITSVKWRVKVLQRLKEFLQKFVEYNNIQCNEKKVMRIEVNDSSKVNSFSLFNPNYISVCHISCFSPKNLQEALQVNEAEKFMKYIETLMPLLFEIWVEACVNLNTDRNFETVISEDGAVLLRNVLEVISLFWTLVEHLEKINPNAQMVKIFSSKYRQQFNQNFLKSFPYVVNLRSKSGKANLEFEGVITDSKLVAENLRICYLFIMLNPNINLKNNHKEITNVLNYVERTFNMNSEEHVNDSVMMILHTIFSNESTNWTKHDSLMDALFRKFIWAYFNKDMPSSYRQKIFSLLCRIALNDKLTHFHKSEAYVKWLNNLPDILLEGSINVQTIDIIHKFAIQNNKAFNAIMKPKLLNIINNLPNLKIQDSLDNSSYQKMFSILYWIKNWDCDSLNLLEKQLLENAYKSNHGKFIFDTLRLKSGSIF